VRRGNRCVRVERPRRCKPGFVLRNGRCVKAQPQRPKPQACPKGTVRNSRGVCIPVRVNRDVLQRAVPRVVRPCPKGQVRYPNGRCGPIPQ